MALNCKCQLCFLKINRLSGTAGLLISRDGFSQEGVAFGIGRTLQVERHSNKRWEKQNFSLCLRMRRFFHPVFLSHIQQFSVAPCVGEPVQNLGSQVNLLLFVPQELTLVLLPACLGNSSALSYWCLRLLVPPVLFLHFVLQKVSKLRNPLFIWVQ